MTEKTLRRCPEQSEGTHSDYRKKGMRFFADAQNDSLSVTLRRSRRVSWGDSSVAYAPSEWQKGGDSSLRLRSAQNDKKRSHRM